MEWAFGCGSKQMGFPTVNLPEKQGSASGSCVTGQYYGCTDAGNWYVHQMVVSLGTYTYSSIKHTVNSLYIIHKQESMEEILSVATEDFFFCSVGECLILQRKKIYIKDT